MSPGPDNRDIKAALRGADAVVFVAGVASVWQSRKGTTLYSVGGGNVLQAMKETGVRTLIAVTSSGVLDDPVKPVIYR